MPPDVVHLDLYRVFEAVARLENVTTAAEELLLSQPAVSQKIRQLENDLGCSLFVRTSRGVHVTAEGEVLYRYAAEGLERFRLGERKLKELLDLDSGEIRVGASDMTLQFCLLPYLEKFHARYPGVKISVTNGPTPETLRLLEQGIIDFGVITEARAASDEAAGDSAGRIPAEGPANRRFPVGQVRDIFVAGSRFRSLAASPLPLRELERLPLICLERSTSTRRYVDRFFASRHTVLSPEFELATSDLIVRFAERNLGIGCVVEDFAADALREHRVWELPLEEPLPPWRICVALGDGPVSPAARQLLDLILS